MLLSADVGSTAWGPTSLAWPASPPAGAGFVQYLPWFPSSPVGSAGFGPFQVASQADGGRGEEEAANYPPAPGSNAPDFPPAESIAAVFPPAPPPPPILLNQLAAARKQQSELFLEDAAGNTWSSIQGPPFDQAFLTGAEGGRAEELQGPPAEWPFDPPAEIQYGPPTPEEMAVTPRVPWTTDYTVNSTLAAGEYSTSFRIPVGPVTNLIKLAVRAEGRDEAYGGPRPPTFKVDQIYLMGPNGKVLAAIAGVASVTDETGQSLLVTIHGAPRGGELLVRVIQTDGFPPIDGGGDPAAPGGSDEAPPASWSPGPFEFNVQRSDASPSPKDEGGRTFASVGTIGAGTSYVIYLPTATHEGVTTPSAAGGASTSEDGGGATSGGLVADADRSAEAATGPDEVEIADEEEAPSVFLGPLVSRTAAALGPALATETDDPTPSTARGGRSGPDAADVLGDHDLGLYLGFASSRARRAAADRADAVADRERGGDDALASLRGAGGVPILVGGLGRNDARNEAEALAENLQRQAEMDELIVDALEADSELEPDPRRAEIARAGLATRAVGFLIGLGLATGPLYPDLVAFARKKLVRKSRHARRRKPAR